VRILLVEDNEELGVSLKRLLDKSYSVDRVENGTDALLATETLSYDLVVLDLSLPDRDGLEILREMRSAGKTVPVLILTARGQMNDRVEGLDGGADDYMTKPFELTELEARIRALLRRSSMEKTSLLQLGDIELDLASNTVSARGALLDISSRETMVLRALLNANGRILPKAQLVETLNSFDSDVSENAVEQYVSRLRKKLTPYGIRIHVARGLGYHLAEAV
jgi:two-component system OmpR family response regulator